MPWSPLLLGFQQNTAVSFLGSGPMQCSTLFSSSFRSSASHETLHGNSTLNPYRSFLTFTIFSTPATGEHIYPKHITLPKKFRSTTSLITAPDKSSEFHTHQTLHHSDTVKPLRFQKAIKKVRAVQRMRRNRGFAFSQTENAARQDQARLIRAYDTSKAGAKPSGY